MWMNTNETSSRLRQNIGSWGKWAPGSQVEYTNGEKTGLNKYETKVSQNITVKGSEVWNGVQKGQKSNGSWHHYRGAHCLFRTMPSTVWKVLFSKFPPYYLRFICSHSNRNSQKNMAKIAITWNITSWSIYHLICTQKDLITTLHIQVKDFSKRFSRCTTKPIFVIQNCR